MKALELKKKLNDNGFADIFTTLYGKENLEKANARYTKAIDEFEKEFGTGRELELFSVAGRSEISGNHTDHNYGKVIAASIDLDIIAVASKRDDNQINIKSEGFPIDKVDVSDPQPVEENFFKSYSIISGMARGFMNNGYKVGGYDAYTTSNVFKGSGLSSSAAFEDMVGNMPFFVTFCANSIGMVSLFGGVYLSILYYYKKIKQYAEHYDMGTCEYISIFSYLVPSVENHGLSRDAKTLPGFSSKVI